MRERKHKASNAKQIKTSTNGVINNNKHSYIVELLFMLYTHVP